MDKKEKPSRKEKHFSFFQNTECEYFPCHRIADPDRFNCLFCYCPLYALGPRCGGNFRYTDKGIKDCTNCLIPHLPQNYGNITARFGEIADMMRRMQDSADPAVPSEEQLAVPSDGQTAVPSGGQSAVLPEGQNAVPSEGQRRIAPGQGRRIVMMACTERGFETMRRAATALARQFPAEMEEPEILQTGRCAYVSGFEEGPGLSELTKKYFHRADALIFFAAAGIAVRCIAPFVRDKFQDPAVLCVDENGRYAVSLLSGHAGGANRLCAQLAGAIGAEPVITTATDGRGLCAIDAFAAEKGLQLSDRGIAKQISARLLTGEQLTLFSEEELMGLVQPLLARTADVTRKSNGSESSRALQSAEEGGRESSRYSQKGEQSGKGVSMVKKKGGQSGKGVSVVKKRRDADIILSWRRCPGDRENALYLIPKQVTAGIGCRKGIDPDRIRQALQEMLCDAGIFREALCGIASIELKKDEPGLHEIAAEWGLPLTFYTARELNSLPGLFSSSAFVRDITGVDCVCERSAMQLAGPGGRLLADKQSLNGVTVSLALRPGLCGHPNVRKLQ